MKKSVLSLLLLVGIASADFIRDDSKEVVLDTKTNLIWQDNLAVKDNNQTWNDALTYCEGLNLGGYDDWHLPNHTELSSLPDRTRYNPSLSSIFMNVGNEPWSSWSSTTFQDDTSKAWLIYFSYNGRDSVEVKTENYIYVRCVRLAD